MLYYVYKIGEWIALTLPLSAGYAIATGIGNILYVLMGRDRKALSRNIRMVVGNEAKPGFVQKNVRDTFVNFSKYLVDFSRYPVMGDEFFDTRVRIIGEEHVAEAARDGKGAILLSTHLGNWELGGAIVARMGYSIHAIVREHAEPRVNAFFTKRRDMVGMKGIPKTAFLGRCISILKQNEMLAVLGDRDFGGSGEAVPFFGRSAFLPRGAAYFAVRSGAPIIPSFVTREKDDTFTMTFAEPVKVTASGDARKDVVSCMKQYLAVVERFIARYPNQWYVFREIWS